jgi:hypothetical protein
MPWKSQAQRSWGHSPEGLKALGGKKAVEEWDRETAGKSIPHRVNSNVEKLRARLRPQQKA